MSRFETEEEQLDAIKTWWKKNGTALLSGVLVVVVTISGWRYWQNSQYVDSANASATFEVLQNNALRGSFGDVARDALKLMNEQPESPYATAAAMLHAKYNLDKGELDEAKTHLQWAIENAPTPELVAVAQLRTARLHAQQGAFEQSQQVLNKILLPVGDSPLQADVDYLQGLIALSKDNKSAAKQAFQSVLDNPEVDENLLGLVEIQLADLTQE